MVESNSRRDALETEGGKGGGRGWGRLREREVTLIEICKIFHTEADYLLNV